MAKSKNHTNHNQSRKDHRNGIKRLPKKKHMSKKGMCPRFLRNQRFARKGTLKAMREKRLADAAAKGAATTST